ncbi:hypothetical protein [Dialister sp.]|uniref:hypothetical protein n=1 Tax=Dialister sp. TaxID=1955814 RepID=UPI00406D51FF
MAHCNEKYLNLQSACLFDEINEKQNAYKESHPDADIISLDIEDGTQPLAPSAAEAMKKAVRRGCPRRDVPRLRPGSRDIFSCAKLLQKMISSPEAAIFHQMKFLSAMVKNTDIGNMQEIFAESDIAAITDLYILPMLTAMSWPAAAGNSSTAHTRSLNIFPAMKNVI